MLYATSQVSLLGQARVDIQQQAALAMEKMVADLMQCSPDGVGVLYAPDASVPAVVLSLHRVVSLSESVPPAQVFDQGLNCYWWTPADRLLRSRRVGLALNTAVASRGGTQEQLLALTSSASAGTRNLAQGVTSLQLICGDDFASPLPSGPPQPYAPASRPPSITNPLSLSLTLEREVKGGMLRNAEGHPCERFRLQRTVWLRDGD